MTAWAPTSLLGQEILQEQTPAGKRQFRNSSTYEASDGVDSMALMDRQPDSPESSFANGKPYRPETVPLPPSAIPTPQAAKSPKRGHKSRNSGSNKPKHPSPLNIGEKLAALQAESMADLHAGPSSPNIRNGRTLQVRHSDSFDGSSYVPSSEDEDSLSDNETERASSPSKSLSMNARSRTRSQDTIMGDRTHENVDLGDEEEELAMESEYLANGGEKGRTADQAGAILGIANM